MLKTIGPKRKEEINTTFGSTVVGSKATTSRSLSKRRIARTKFSKMEYINGPEIPYDIEKVVAAIQKRSKAGKRFTILAVAEGAISKEDALLSKKDYKKKLEDRAKKYPSVSYEIADKITQKLGSEVRITVPGHTQRGGAPCAYDRVLSTRIGAGAAEAILDGEYGIMIGIVNGKIKRVPLEECAGGRRKK